MDFIRFTLWPTVKVRLTYWWWVLRYGGKKNIPPELIFGKIEGSMARMRENLEQALRVLPQNMTEAEKKEVFDLLRTAGVLEKEIKDLHKE